MRFGCVLAGLIALSQPAFALSCLAPDITRDYQKAAQSDDTYILVKGDLFFDEAVLPERTEQRSSRSRDRVDVDGWLSGYSLTKDGFTKRFERDVILRVSCLGPWCGSTSKGEHLAFLRQEDRQWVMELSPCPGMTYADPSPEQEATALACFRGEPCVPQ
ncbi:hypothetical protein [Marivita sp. XM-24bin2]|jgi:hypothetical protein|uniref:hypothetical protein n=1 Tax=unclassified Marivita TaxID=2632480 RepID=UPI000D7A77F9|nr:hypothetical protein [Marivita sp. XM-24bin2]MCR9108318.1 hypothetical protein [Paracoccaceae bacterium]PWL36275.1 MAG: hypothetical protein DCO97_04750 [Marivita sp. XM-24bin2]